MTQAELFALLKTTGLQVAYRQWNTGQEPSLPYLIYLQDGTDNFGADNKAYMVFTNYIIELYTERKDPTTESALEGIFNENEIYWDKQETYIDSERMYQISYSI